MPRTKAVYFSNRALNHPVYKYIHTYQHIWFLAGGRGNAAYDKYHVIQ